MSVIDEMPLSEFMDHKVFWEKHRWGLTDDLMAATLAQVVAGRTKSKPQTNLTVWKEMVFSSTYVVKRIGHRIKEMNKRIRAGIMSMATAIQRRAGK